MKRIKIGFAGFGSDYVPENHFFVKILKNHFDVEIIDTRNKAKKKEVEYLFCSVFSQDFLDYDCIRILYTGENFIPDFNLYDYAIGFERMEVGDRYFCDPLFYGYLRDSLVNMPDRSDNVITKEGISTKKFCAMVVSNKGFADRYRTDFFHRLSEYKKVDSGGLYLNNIGYRVDDKLSFIKNYKFSLAMENVKYEGYCTEKILDSFAAGTIPIYWGDEGVADYFNEKAFINCSDASSMDEIVEKIREIDNDDEKYLSMLREPVFASDYYSPRQQDVCFENWLVSIFEKEYKIRRSCMGYMKIYEQRCRKQRDLQCCIDKICFLRNWGGKLRYFLGRSLLLRRLIDNRD